MIDELEVLTQAKNELDTKRDELINAVSKAADLLSPLHSQMQTVLSVMKDFREAQESYIELSKEAYKSVENAIAEIDDEM